MALLSDGVGNNRGAVLGGLVIVMFLEAAPFITPLIPALSPVVSMSPWERAYVLPNGR